MNKQPVSFTIARMDNLFLARTLNGLSTSGVPFGGAGYPGDQIFHAPGALSQLHTLCVTQLLQAPRIICLRFTQLHTFACFCTIDHTTAYMDHVLPNGFHKSS